MCTFAAHKNFGILVLAFVSCPRHSTSRHDNDTRNNCPHPHQHKMNPCRLSAVGRRARSIGFSPNSFRRSFALSSPPNVVPLQHQKDAPPIRLSRRLFSPKISMQYQRKIHRRMLSAKAGGPGARSDRGGDEGGGGGDSSSTSSEPLVLFSHDESTKIITITLNSPSTYNALTVEMGDEFRSLVSRIGEDLRRGNLDANACVLAGSGGRAFSSGGDLAWLRSRGDVPPHLNADGMRDFYGSFLCVRELPVPVVAAVRGPAMGAGACLALACDLRVAYPEARIGFNFASLGIHAGMGASHFLPRTMGRAAANEALLTGKVFTGKEALAVGLVNRLAGTAEDVVPGALSLAEEIARQHPVAVRSMVRSIRMDEDAGLEPALRREADAQTLCYAYRDWGEGLDAALERRRPAFGSYHEK